VARRHKENNGPGRNAALELSLLVALAIFAVEFPYPTFTQPARPLLKGKVSSQGKALADVKVTATNRETGKVYTAFTDSAGQYEFLKIPEGTYSLAAAKYRYSGVSRKGIIIRSGELATLDFELEAIILYKGGEAPSKPAPPPPPPQPPPTPKPDSQPRITVRSFLVGKEEEKDGYGLYSYLLFGTPPSELVRNRYLEAIRAYLTEIQDVKSVQEYIPPQRLNITYLPLTQEPTSANPTPEWVLDSYNYPRAEALLLKVPDGLHPGGPYIISTLTPLSKADIVFNDYLYLDLSAVPPGVILPWIKEFMVQASQQRFWEKRDYEQWVLKLRTAIEDMAVALPAVNKAGKDWKDLMASMVWHGSK
jgi:hypothetical protein